MQTFLPYEGFFDSAKVLDNRRLGNQLNEAAVLYGAITEGNGWSDHPAARMWRGYPAALAWYGVVCYVEWRWRLHCGLRGGKPAHRSGDLLCARADARVRRPIRRPAWLGDPAFHAAHRAALLAKDPEWYQRWGWDEEAADRSADGRWPYVWPVA
jgi:hypothetical protein